MRDAASAEGFAGYGLFQNLIVGGQDEQGMDVTNELSYMCLEAQLHVRLPQPSLSIRVWTLTPHALLIKAASVTREGLGVPAFYNDEVIIPSMMSRGYTLEDARNYCIIGCVEPQACAKTDGWHDAAFFNMLRPLELVFSNGVDKGEQIGPRTGDVLKMTSFEEFYKAYTTQESALIEMMVQADNAVDVAHAVRCPLPFESCLIDDCISRGKSVQEGGAHYNFTGPQGFGIANVADSLAVVRELVFEKKLVSMAELKQALADAEDVLIARGERFGPYRIGVMIETPAAVFMSGELAGEVDFFSIGTNDLTQYLLAMDRQNPNLAPFCDPHHPAILRAIRHTVECAHQARCSVGICGELAADEDLTEAFLRMGVDELSVAPARILPLRQKIRSLTLG